MRVEIDQSGKVEQLDTDTILAYSNGSWGAIKIKVAVKRRIIQFLRKTSRYGTDFSAELFAVTVFLLVQELSPNTIFVIDEEYSGKNKEISEKLEGFLIQKYGKKWHGGIRFERIGKHSRAHFYAWEIHDKNRKLVTKAKLIEEAKILGFYKKSKPALIGHTHRVSR